MLWQPPLPDQYLRLMPDQLDQRIRARKAELGQSLVILGHHYQADDTIAHADHTGDSLRLSQIAARIAQTQSARFVVFCGVHFMAETADLLTPDHVAVLLPDLTAGCSMADMATYEDALFAWNNIHSELETQGFQGRVIPITYVNSTAAVKAFVGAQGGACCTSSNADRVFHWALAGGTVPKSPSEQIKILFLPDQHLGRNTAAAQGINVAKQTAVFDPKRMNLGEPLGGMTPAQLKNATCILWAGHCSVHKLFTPEHCQQLRELDAQNNTQTTIIVHPECTKEVVDLADLAGSTEFIINHVQNAQPGSRFAIGTEVHLVNRLAQSAKDKSVAVSMLSECQCLCTTMYRIDPAHLLWTLDQIHATPDSLTNVIRVHKDARRDALLAIDRMLTLTQQQPDCQITSS